ncbi:uncharacterized protein LOC131874979 [Cryptomeria japonica]|uniref:uncharacterized protein LOC131874979 n=1 Tax=Cryptomeria japonica TaxID=3369 RepID=UPI0027DA723A|nr:uncharacterized protein LOC131874979 [Cryptomeria japonica]
MEGNACDTINVADDSQVKNVFIGKTYTSQERNGILKNVRDFPDVTAWSYEDLKTYDTAIITHTIPLKPGSKLDLNRASEKDNYPLPLLDEVLQIVNRSQMMSFLDGYSDYNQVLVEPEDRLKTAFTTKWGTFAYKRMPFGLINVRATFQRAMDIAFRDLIGKCIIIYMDDITFFSRKREDHVDDLRKVFQRCKSYSVSLNPKKCIFGVMEGKLLGHVISEKGISIDPDRVKAISTINLPASKKELKSFFSKINFVRKFIIGFTEIVRPLNEMLKKDAKIEWSTQAKRAFEEIKLAIVEAPALAQTLAVDGPRLIQQVYELDDVTLDGWNKEILTYLLNKKCRARMTPTQKRALRIKCQHYMLQGSILYRRNHEGIYLRCVGKEEAKQIIEHFHSKFGTRHGANLAIAHQILRAGYYWPTLFKDTFDHVKTCHTCQVTTFREKNPTMPLNPMIEARPFAKWGMDFIGVINPASSAQHRYIITATNYCTRWLKAQALKAKL